MHTSSSRSSSAIRCAACRCSEARCAASCRSALRAASSRAAASRCCEISSSFSRSCSSRCPSCVRHSPSSCSVVFRRCCSSATASARSRCCAASTSESCSAKPRWHSVNARCASSRSLCSDSTLAESVRVRSSLALSSGAFAARACARSCSCSSRAMCVSETEASARSAVSRAAIASPDTGCAAAPEGWRSPLPASAMACWALLPSHQAGFRRRIRCLAGRSSPPSRSRRPRGGRQRRRTLWHSRPRAPPEARAVGLRAPVGETHDSRPAGPLLP